MELKKNTEAANNDEPDNSLDEYSYRSFGETLLPYFRKLWSIRRKLIIVESVVMLVTIAILLLFVPPYFDSTITILPDFGAGAQSGVISGLAAIAGLSLPEASNPMPIYQNLLTSESVIAPVVYAHYRTERFKDSVDLIRYFGKQPDESIEPQLRQRKVFLEVFRQLTKSVISLTFDPLVNILTVTVRMPEGRLSSTVANNLVKSLDDYVRTKRKSNATEQRSYIERRGSEVFDSLTVAENNLKNFQLRNRVVEQSPELAMEQSRLSLQLQILQGVYSELTRQLELAKIEEIKNAPVVHVREFAQEPPQKSGPNRTLIVILVFLASAMLTTLYFLLIEGKKVLDYFREIIFERMEDEDTFEAKQT